MAYWLFKSEPSTWSWDNQVAKGDAGEDGGGGGLLPGEGRGDVAHHEARLAGSESQ